MKKFFATIFAMAAMAVQAQYIPNGNFENWKGSCGDTYQSSRTEYRQRPGDEPTGWEGSSINQKVSVATKSETLIFKSTGRSGSAVKMQNKYVGALGIGSNAPGFISFATPWVYAVTTVSKCDGGVYGGMAFNHRPDAIKGWFKRTGGTGEKAHIIVYLWKGTFKNDIASDKSNDTKDDTDRAVMGTVSSTGNGVRIASCDHTFTTTTNNDWQEITVPLNYENDYIPEKLNVILSSGDYWIRDNMKDGSVLEADDVQFVYYSELASLTYNGKNYFQSGKTSYTIDEYYNESKLSVTSNGKGATIEKSYNASTGVLTITVKGNDYAANSSNVHTYTVNFKTVDIVAVTPNEVLESLKTITIEYSDEITGTYNASASSKIYVGSKNNTASFTVSGKVLTITLDKAIEASGEYALYIPEGLITHKSSGVAVVCNGDVKFKVYVPFRVVAVTPCEEVEYLRTMTVEYNYDITGTYRESDEKKIYLGSNNNVAAFKVDGKVLTVTLIRTITEPGEYELYIPEGLIKRKDNGEAVTCDGEIKFTIKEVPEDQRFRMIAVTPSETVDSLDKIVLEYNEEIVGTYQPLLFTQIYVDSIRTTTKPLKVNGASFSVDGKLLNIDLLETITAPGEYALYIPAGLITRKNNGADVVCKGEVRFTVNGVSPEQPELPEQPEQPEQPGQPAVDYIPAFTGVKTRGDRWITNISLAGGMYAGESSNSFTVDNSGQLCYNNYADAVEVKAAPGEVVALVANVGENTLWVNLYAYLDADNDGFTAAIADGSNWRPVGDLVSYSFYNDGVSSDEMGWNSVGATMMGDDRNTVYLPEFKVPSVPGRYRMRVKMDWCNIDPAGDRDGMHGDFMENGGQIVDFMLNVFDDSAVEPEPEPEPTPNPDIDYTPANTGTRNYAERDINTIKFVSAKYGEKVYDLTSSERSSEYIDLTESFVFTVAPGEQASLEIVTGGSWVNHYVYIDYDFNGFTASIEGGSNWKPSGDLVAYSFYNNGGSSDDSGWNSEGQMITGDARSFPSLPAFVVAAKPGKYRMRIKQDWCSIDPAGDSDSNFGGTFSTYGGQIIDIILDVVDSTGVEEIEAEDGEVAIYDMHGRKLEKITAPGLYIIGGKKVLVK